jgi:hypothetical protein
MPYKRKKKGCLKLMGMLESVKFPYNTLVGIRQSQHLTFKNVLLSSVVSNNVNFNQRHIVILQDILLKMQWSSEFMLIKAGKNSKGGMPQKR